MTRDDIINALTKAGFKIAPETSQLIIYAYKAPTSIVCSILAANATVSVSFGGLPDLDKAKKLIKKIKNELDKVEQFVKEPKTTLSVGVNIGEDCNNLSNLLDKLEEEIKLQLEN